MPDEESEPGLGLSELHAALGSDDPARRADAVRRVRSDPGVEQALVETLSDPDEGVRRASVTALGRLGGPVATRALIRMSAIDPSPEVRGDAVEALGRLARQGGP